MPKTDREFVDFKAIKQSVSMLQILEHYGLMDKLRRAGDRISGRCPIHKGQNQTAFRVSVEKNCWNCFSDCKCGGNVLDFVSKMEGVDILEAAMLIKGWFKLTFSQREDERSERRDESRSSRRQPEAPKKKEQPAEPKTGENPPLKFALNHLEPEHPYLSERGLTAETVAKFGLGFCQKGIMAGHIAIPVHNAKGELIAYAGRFPGEPKEPDGKYRLPKGFKKSLEVFNLHRASTAPPDKPLVIVEGFFDCMKLSQAGVTRVVSLMGSTLCDAQAEHISKLITRDQRVILLFDEDDSGRSCREQALQRFAAKAYVRVIEFEKEGTQPDQLTPEEIDGLALREHPATYGIERKAVVRLGKLLSTPSALEKIPNPEILAAIARHQSGDWGDVSKEDWSANERALKEGTRLLSVYRSLAGVKFWIITEADRSVTTVLLPEDY